MALSGLGMLALKALYEAPEYSGDLVALLKDNVSVHQAQAAGKELRNEGYIEKDFEPTRGFADATLTKQGIALAKKSRRLNA